MLNIQICSGLLKQWELIFSYQTCPFFLHPVFKSFAGSWKKEKLSSSLQFKFQLSSRIGIPESHRICKNLTKSTESANQSQICRAPLIGRVAKRSAKIRNNSHNSESAATLWKHDSKRATKLWKNPSIFLTLLIGRF